MITIDIDVRNEANLPISKRKFVNIAWIKFLAKPIRRILAEYYTYLLSNELLIHMNGQVIYIEHILNHYFDQVNEGIYITDSLAAEEGVILYNDGEDNEETYLYNDAEDDDETYFFNREEIENFPDFIINIPSTVTYNEQQLRALVNRFKIAGKNYVIKII